MISKSRFQYRSCDFDWPQFKCNLGARHGNIAKKKGALAVHEDSDSKSKTWSSEFIYQWEERWVHRGHYHLDIKGDSFSYKLDRLFSSCLANAKVSVQWDW